MPARLHDTATARTTGNSAKTAYGNRLHVLTEQDGGHDLRQSDREARRHRGEADIVQAQSDNGDDAGRGDGADVFQYRDERAGIPDRHLHDADHDDGALDDPHGVREPDVVRQRLQFGILDNGERRRQVGEAPALYSS